MITRVLSVAAALVMVAACGSSSGSSASAAPNAGSSRLDPKVALCAALDTQGQALAALDALPADATVDQYKTVAANAKAALAAIGAASGPFAAQFGNQLDQVNAGTEGVVDAIERLGADAKPADIEAALAPMALSTLVQDASNVRGIVCVGIPAPSAAS